MTNNAHFFYILSHCYMFRHYRVILRELVINTLQSKTSISNAAVGNILTIKKFHVKHLNTLRTGEADLRFYVTTLQDG